MTDLEKMFDQYKEKINLEPDSEEKIQKTIKAARQAYLESKNANLLKQPGRIKALFKKMKMHKRLIPAAAILSICFIAVIIAGVLGAAKPADSKQSVLPIAAASPKPKKTVVENDSPKTATPAQTAAPTLGPTAAPADSYSEYTLAQNNDGNTSSTYPNVAMISDFNYRIYLDEISYTPEWDTTLNENITVDAQYVGEYIGQTIMQKYANEKGEDFLDCDIFAIQNVSSRCAVACVPHAGNYQNVYLLFIAENYSPSTWGELKENLHLEENLMIAANLDQPITLNDKLCAVGQYNGDYDAILQYLFHLPDTAAIDNSIDPLLDPYWENTINESVNIKSYLEPFGTQGMRTGLGQMTVYDTGYLNAGLMGESLWFYIGETVAQECIDMVKNNLIPIQSSEAYSGDEYIETNPN